MVEKKKKGAITNDELARLMTKGFADVRGDLTKLVKSEVGGLARMTAKGFAEVHDKMAKGFAEVDEKFAEVHKKMDDGFDGIKTRLTHIDNRLDITATHERRLIRLEKHAGILG